MVQEPAAQDTGWFVDETDPLVVRDTNRLEVCRAHSREDAELLALAPAMGLILLKLDGLLHEDDMARLRKWAGA